VRIIAILIPLVGLILSIVGLIAGINQSDDAPYRISFVVMYAFNVLFMVPVFCTCCVLIIGVSAD